MSLKSIYDVAVIGAGPAGVAAVSAIAATRQDADILLLESSRRMGGAVTAAMHRSLCGLYAARPQDATDTLNDGVQRHFIESMKRLDPEGVQAREQGKVWVLDFPTSAWDAALSQILTETGAHLRLGCRVAKLRRYGARIEAIDVEGASSGWVGVKTLIDCTGSGAILEMAGQGAVLLRASETGRMLGGYALRVKGLRGSLEVLRLEVPYALAKAVERNELPNEARFTVFTPGPGEEEGVCKLAVNPQAFGTERVPELADRVLACLVRDVEGFAKARVKERSAHELPRDGAQLHGRPVVTEDDVLGARRHGPGAVHAWWPVERWDVDAGPTYAYPPAGQPYDVPDDALRSNAIENLFAGGMCISATPGAAASARASGICLATGAAAGRLAAEAAGT